METSRPEWSDWLEGYLFDRRVTVLRGALDDEAATRLATELMTLDATGDEPVTLQLDSSGGTYTAALTLVDVIELLGVPLNVLCMGRVEGTAVVVAAAGAHRLALPHTQFRLSEPRFSVESLSSQAQQLAEAHLELSRRYYACLARFTHHSVEEIGEWCASGKVLDASEAKERGIIDEISQTRGPLRRVH